MKNNGKWEDLAKAEGAFVCESTVVCADNPCKNGNCTDHGETYSCNCFSDWTGDTCEQNKDDLIWTVSNQTCTSHGSTLDAMFVIDGSSSFGSENFKDTLNFLATMSGFFFDLAGENQAGFIVANDTANLISELQVPPEGLAQTQKWLKSFEFPGGSKGIAKGMDLAISQFKEKESKVENTSSLLLVLTDGNSLYDLATQADIAKDHNITVYLIGLGSEIKSKKTRKIFNEETRVFTATNATAFRAILEDVELNVCKDLVGLKIRCSHDDQLLTMTTFVPKHLQVARDVTIGSCPSVRLEDAAIQTVNWASDFWYATVRMNQCGTNFSFTADHVRISNTLWLKNERESVVIRAKEHGELWGIHCDYDRTAIMTSGMNVDDWKWIDEGNEGTLPMTMRFFRTSLFSALREIPASVQLNERVFIEVHVDMRAIWRRLSRTVGRHPTIAANRSDST